MLQILGIIFILASSIGYYKLSNINSNIYFQSQISLTKYISSSSYPSYTVYGTCIDKQVLSQDPFISIRIKSQHQFSYVMSLNKNPLLECQELSQTVNLKIVKQNSSHLVSIQNINEIKAIMGEDTSIIQLQRSQYMNLNKKDQYYLLFVYSFSPPAQAASTVNAVINIQNFHYSQNILKSIFWFSWFSLIAICLISYYRKNIFNSKIKLSLSIITLSLLIWISYTQTSILNIQDQIKILMISNIVIISIKNNIDQYATFIIVIMFVMYNLLSDYHVIEIIVFTLFAVLELMGIGSICKYGQNYKFIIFSIFNFLLLTLSVNRFFQFNHPFILILITVSIVFGIVVYELLQLSQDFSINAKKTQQRLQSYQISEDDRLFRN